MSRARCIMLTVPAVRSICTRIRVSVLDSTPGVRLSLPISSTVTTSSPEGTGVGAIGGIGVMGVCAGVMYVPRITIVGCGVGVFVGVLLEVGVRVMVGVRVSVLVRLAVGCVPRGVFVGGRVEVASWALPEVTCKLNKTNVRMTLRRPIRAVTVVIRKLIPTIPILLIQSRTIIA